MKCEQDYFSLFENQNNFPLIAAKPYGYTKFLLFIFKASTPIYFLLHSAASHPHLRKTCRSLQETIPALGKPAAMCRKLSQAIYFLPPSAAYFPKLQKACRSVQHTICVILCITTILFSQIMPYFFKKSVFHCSIITKRGIEVNENINSHIFT